jgi:hypothetical protein
VVAFWEWVWGLGIALAHLVCVRHVQERHKGIGREGGSFFRNCSIMRVLGRRPRTGSSLPYFELHDL